MIKLENVWKEFVLERESPTTLKERFIKKFRKARKERIVALRDVNLEIKKGECFGILGKNGAGKTTLLKIIAGILKPTRGKVYVEGKIVPILGLGLGFQRELTARENVFLYASILGLSQEEIEEKFDEIVEFSELRNMMDVKLKDFSDGMLARLSFSVAFHVDADIILIDEVIAVGDLGFQRKCLEKIENLKREGKTIVLVSQSPDIIRKFCDRGMILKEGKVVFQGSGAEVAEEYTDMIESERLIETNTKKDLKFCARYKHDFILKGGEKAIMEVDGDVEEIIFFGKTIAKAVTLRKEDGKTIFYTDALPLNEGHYDVLIRQGEKVFGPFKIYVKRGKKRNGERVFVVWGKPFKGLTLVSGEKKEKIDRLYREGNSVFIFFDLEDLDEEVSLYEKHEIVFSGKKEEAFKILKEKVSKQLALRYFQDILENKELGRIVIA